MSIDSMSLAELKALIDAEGLDNVKKIVGGSQRRTHSTISGTTSAMLGRALLPCRALLPRHGRSALLQW